MTLKTLAAAACLSIATATAGFAATFTVNGTAYDITTFRGTFNNDQSVLSNQPWFGDAALALTFAETVGNGLGNPNTFGGTPFFAIGPSATNAALYQFAACFFICQGGGVAVKSGSFVFATASPVSAVPLPAGGLLLLSGLGGVAALKRRKKRAA